MLRVHRRGFPGRDVEEPRVEAVDAIQEAGPFADGPARGGGIGIIERRRGPALGRDLRDQAFAGGKRPPEAVEVRGTGETTGHTDDRDVADGQSGGNGGRGCRDRGDRGCLLGGGNLTEGWRFRRHQTGDMRRQRGHRTRAEQDLHPQPQPERAVDGVEEPDPQKGTQPEFRKRRPGRNTNRINAQRGGEQRKNAGLHPFRNGRRGHQPGYRPRRLGLPQGSQFLRVGDHATPICRRFCSARPGKPGRRRAVISR